MLLYPKPSDKSFLSNFWKFSKNGVSKVYYIRTSEETRSISWPSILDTGAWSHFLSRTGSHVIVLGPFWSILISFDSSWSHLIFLDPFWSLLIDHNPSYSKLTLQYLTYLFCNPTLSMSLFLPNEAMNFRSHSYSILTILLWAPPSLTYRTLPTDLVTY